MDPYKVLGLEPSASDEDVKKAYKTLAKKYHPDMNVGAPNIKELEARFKQVQAAYNMIMEGRAGGGPAYTGPYAGGGGQSYGPGYEGFGGFGAYGDLFREQQRRQQEQRQRQAQAQAQPGGLELEAAEHYINARRYREALTALSSVAERARGGRWYYLAALANAGLGNNETARRQAQKAASLDPTVAEYRYLAEQLAYGGAQYRQRQAQYSRPSLAGGRLCLYCILANFLCNCLCFGSRYR